MLRAKFKVESYETRLESNKAGSDELRSVTLSVVYGDSEENKKFFRWTPNGRIVIGLLNPDAWKQLALGTEVYVDFSPVNPEVPVSGTV